MFNDVPATVARVDLRRYCGRWFEIARLPNRRQAEDCTDVTSDYSLVDGGIRISRRCIGPQGLCRSDEGVLTPASESRAKLKVSFARASLRWLPFSHHHYWVLRLSPDYTMSLVGTPGRRRLWLLARTRHPDPALRDAFLEHAARSGYDLTALIHTQQDRAPRITPSASATGETRRAAAPVNADRADARRVGS